MFMSQGATGLEIHSGLGILLVAHVPIGKIHFLSVAELLGADFFKDGRVISLISGKALF